MNDVERRYRRVLRWYPRDHRERNGEEMLGVLLADARGPGWRETADLLWGAARLHLRRIVGVDGGFDPRDVLAIVSLLAPLAMLAGAASEVYQLGVWVEGGWGSDPWTYVVPDAWLWAGWLVVAVLAVAGLRRTAAAGAWLGTAGFVIATVVSLQQSWSQRWWTGPDLGWVLLGALAAVALTLSAGPRRGRELVGRWSIAVLAGAVALLLAFGFVAGWRLEFAPFNTPLVGWTMLAITAVGAAASAGLRSRVGRRATLLLLLPMLTLLPAAVAASGLLPDQLFDLLAGNVPTVVEVAVFGGAPVVVVLMALGVLPNMLRRARKPVA